jgi:predicted component of type VI protein secretion system
MISDRQNSFYWGLWGKAKIELMHGRETWTQLEENNRRHELHVRAIGYDKSHYDLTNREFDRVIAELRLVAGIGDAGRRRGSAAEAHRRRMYFGLRGLMRKLRVSEEYVQAISRRMFLGLEIGDLKTDELQKLMIALREHERRHAA